MREFGSELNRVAKMAKSNLDLLPNVKHPEFFLTDAIPFSKTIIGKFHDINGFSFSASFLLAYYGIEKKGVIYFLDGFSEFWNARRLSLIRSKLLLYCMYGFDEHYRREDFVRQYPKIFQMYLRYGDPIKALQTDVYNFNSKIFNELKKSDPGNFRPTGVFGLDYSFTVDYGKEQVPSIGRLSLISREEMKWI